MNHRAQEELEAQLDDGDDPIARREDGEEAADAANSYRDALKNAVRWVHVSSRLFGLTCPPCPLTFCMSWARLATGLCGRRHGPGSLQDGVRQ